MIHILSIIIELIWLVQGICFILKYNEENNKEAVKAYIMVVLAVFCCILKDLGYII